MAPTIYHQCVLMIDILKKFNWTDFAIVTTTTFHYLEFTNAIDAIVKEHNDKVKFDRKLRFVSIFQFSLNDRFPERSLNSNNASGYCF